MIIFNLKNHRSGTSYKNPHFFILNKGLNTGKPLNEPCANCFVITFRDETDCENMFCIVRSLWQVQFWRQFLIGSVILYMRIKDFDKMLTAKTTEMMKDFEAHQKNIEAIKLLELKEKQLNENLILINDIKRVILHRYCKK